MKPKSGIKPHTVSTLEEQFDSYHISNMNINFINFLNLILYLHKVVERGSFIYLANVYDLPIHYILTRLKKETIIRTFDDGILNINSISDINKMVRSKTSIKNILTKILFNNNFTIKKIIESSSLHFSILPKNKKINVKSDVVFINVFDNDKESFENVDYNIDCKVVNIFIGSKFRDILKNKNDTNLLLLKQYISHINEKFDDLIYLRHPREISEDIFGMDEIKIKSISEDFIFSLSKQDKIINVIGFASTCQMNVMNLPGVNIILLKTDIIRDDILESFSLFDNERKVSIYNIDELLSSDNIN